MRSGLTAAVMLAAALAMGGALAGEAAPKGPLAQGAGLAAKYMRDAGVEGDPAVIFHDGFESGSKWDGRSRRSTVTEEAANVHSGRKALEFVAPAGRGTGGNVGKRFAKGRERIFLRWYMKFASDFDQDKLTHTGGGIAACAPGVNVPGNAGVRPNGRNKYCTALDPWRGWGRNASPGNLILYTYHMDQRDKWGDNLTPKTKNIPALGKWGCYEIMLQANTPGQKDGRAAMWQEGRLIGDFADLRFRSSESLLPNKIWLVVYMHNSKQANTAWFDDVVAATKYIGPMRTEPSKPAKPVASKPIAPAVSAEEAKAARAEKEAGRLFQMARRAERMGQRTVAASLYRQIIEKFPETQAAKKAKEKLE